jgi:hypothetical protein
MGPQHASLRNSCRIGLSGDFGENPETSQLGNKKAPTTLPRPFITVVTGGGLEPPTRGFSIQVRAELFRGKCKEVKAIFIYSKSGDAYSNLCRNLAEEIILLKNFHDTIQ